MRRSMAWGLAIRRVSFPRSTHQNWFSHTRPRTYGNVLPHFGRRIPVIERNQVMPESPYASPQTDDTPSSVIITDASKFRMPHNCVVCGTDVSPLFSYTQDHLPLVGPGIGLVRTTQVAIPYCAEHREAFQRRFRRLRIAQGVVYAVLVICGFTIFFEPVRLSFGWDPKPGLVSGVFGGVLFLFLLVTIFGIKPFLYDVFIKRSGNRIRIKSRSGVFIQRIIEANQAIVQ
jgi:hypothetical protein